MSPDAAQLASSRPLRAALAGYGFGGRYFHAPQLVAAGFTVAAVSTASTERVAQARAELPGAVVVDDLAALLALDDLDVVVVSTPTALHANHIRAVLDAGIPCVSDKPMTASAASARELTLAAEASGVPLTVFQNRRYDRAFRAARAVVDSGAVGQVLRGEHRWGRFRPVPRGGVWREDLTSEEGGGLLLDLGAHTLDQAVQLHGPVVSVYAELEHRTTRAEDDVFLACRHATGQISHHWICALDGAPGPRMRLTGSAASFLIASQDGENTAFPDLADAPGRTGWLMRGDEREPGPAVGADDPAAFYGLVGEALRGGGAMPVDPWDHVHVLEVIDAARESARTGRTAPVEVATRGR